MIISTCCNAKESGIPNVCNDCLNHADFVNEDTGEAVTWMDGSGTRFDLDGMLREDFYTPAQIAQLAIDAYREVGI